VKLPPLSEPCATLTLTHTLLLIAHTDGSLSAFSLPCGVPAQQQPLQQSPQQQQAAVLAGISFRRRKCVGLARTIYIRCVYGVLAGKSPYTVIYGV